MLDLRLIRQEPELIREMLEKGARKPPSMNCWSWITKGGN